MTHEITKGMSDCGEYDAAIFDTNSSPYSGSFDDLKPSALFKDGREVTTDIVLHIVSAYLSGELTDQRYSYNGDAFEIVEPAIVETLFSEEGKKWL